MAQDETRATLSHFRGLNLNPKTLIPKTLHLHSPRSPNRTPPARTDTYHNECPWQVCTQLSKRTGMVSSGIKLVYKFKQLQSYSTLAGCGIDDGARLRCEGAQASIAKRLLM